MAKVLITGMSGTGKSSALHALAGRGHRTVDTDTGEWSRWTTLPGGSRDWIWREDAMTALLSGPGEGHLFVAGCKSNQGAFHPQFDAVVLLSAPAGVLLARVAARTGNPYGKTAEERAAILEHLQVVEPLLRATATAELDATAPLETVTRQLEDLAAAAVVSR
ncbi:AAA family ATPase [Couchioplanes caeruleus]|uniref:AAA family ATPase n=1 Tax=Couchioplanes caeruleus TaxID=56438 RepID=UPI0020BF8D17|nr:AAA family ATPase [Couchioplanes caeruleus]UQU62463.1 AAA family ATPase [Couchioplanes caeruleus]